MRTSDETLRKGGITYADLQGFSKKKKSFSTFERGKSKYMVGDKALKLLNNCKIAMSGQHQGKQLIYVPDR